MLDLNQQANVKATIGVARVAFLLLLQLKNIWKSKVLSLKNKIRILNANVKAVLLYGIETWRTTLATTKRIQTFVNSCLRRILGFWWPEISVMNGSGNMHVRCWLNRRSNKDAGDGACNFKIYHKVALEMTS